MKFSASRWACGAACLVLWTGAALAQTAPSPLKTDSQKTFYALGAALGRNAAQFNLSPAEMKDVLLGFQDAARSRPLKVDMSVYMGKLSLLVQARQAKKAAAQKKTGQAYLAKAAKQKGAKTFPSGLIYIPIKEGSGKAPKASDTVKVNYTGRLVSGKVFDSSAQHGGKPIEFPLSNVIPCWTEGIQKMKVGGKAKLVCPSSIAYGDKGAPPVIPPGATLVFDVDLLGISGRP
ncbi:MAG: FKBP-type peptidyl-prolyl cis-trans isomerase [Elusimicrobiota bacterium]